MKKIMMIVLALLLTACGGEDRPALAPEMIASMNARADQYDAYYPDGADMNIARQCAAKPMGLYWNEDIQNWAVICALPSLPNTYGAVLLDASYKVLNTDYINAVSQAALEELIGSMGWEQR